MDIGRSFQTLGAVNSDFNSKRNDFNRTSTVSQHDFNNTSTLIDLTTTNKTSTGRLDFNKTSTAVKGTGGPASKNEISLF